MTQDTAPRGHTKNSDLTVHELKNKATDQFEKMTDKATNQIKDVADKAGHVVSSMSEHGREASERVQEVAGTIKNAVDRSVKHQPMAALAIAAVTGFVIGAVWKL